MVFISRSLLPNRSNDDEPGTLTSTMEGRAGQDNAAAVDVLLENDDLLVLNKPPGIAMHGGSAPAGRFPTKTAIPFNETVETFLRGREGGGARDGGAPMVLPVHRLDKDTSGCVLYAKHRRAAVALSDAFAKRGNKGTAVQKVYVACLDVSALPSHAYAGGDSGTIEMPLKKGKHKSSSNSNSKSQMERVQPHLDDGDCEDASSNHEIQDAKTLFHFLHVCRQTRVAWVCFQPLTGRTHQLRAHSLYALGAPILGDMKYSRHLKDGPLSNHPTKSPESQFPSDEDWTVDRGTLEKPHFRSCLHLHALRLSLHANGTPPPPFHSSMEGQFKMRSDLRPSELRMGPWG
jgi:23S rRNA-/tRNA-specific pseudouridylate synthase